MASVPDTKIVDEIPSTMQKLARLVARGFYGVDHSVVVDLLIRNVCMREDDLRELIRFDVKQLRTVLISLKNSKIIKERQLVEQRDNRQVRQNYYFINYRALLNVMKYKVDHMRRKLESEEKTSTHRSTFKCSKCKKPYSDLDINLLWNGDEMQCTFCRGVVEEDTAALPNQSARSSLARFNEQMWPFFQLMQELEGVQLSPALLEPTPMVNKNRMDFNDSNAKAGGGGGGGSRRNEFEVYKQGFTVNIEGTGDGFSDATAGTAGKEVPVWMQTSTLSPTAGSSSIFEQNDEQAASALGIKGESTFSGFSPRQQDIVNTLLVHEAAAAPAPVVHPVIATENLKEEMKDGAVEIGEEDEDEEFEEVGAEEDIKVNVRGKAYSMSDVSENPELLGQMTEEEKAQYIRLSQLVFQSMYGDD